MRLVGLWLAVFLAAWMVATPALARGKGTRAKARKVAKPTKTLALSVGYPNDGKLVGAKRLRETKYMKSLPDYRESAAKWALPELHELLDRASKAVAKRYPGSVLGLGEFSGPNGGPIRRHRSHQTGRDVDVGFYLVSGKGRAMRPLRLVDMNADGTSTVRATTRFDEKRNWAFIAALLQDKKVEVTNIFVWSPLRARLLAHAEKIKAPLALRRKAAQVMSQPANVQRHADHFHIRIACPESLLAKGCINSARRRAPVAPASPSKGVATSKAAPEPDFRDDDEDMDELQALPQLPPATGTRPRPESPEPTAPKAGSAKEPLPEL